MVRMYTTVGKRTFVRCNDHSTTCNTISHTLPWAFEHLVVATLYDLYAQKYNAKF